MQKCCIHFTFQNKQNTSTTSDTTIEEVPLLPATIAVANIFNLRDKFAILDKDRCEMVATNHEKLCNEIKITGTHFLNVMTKETASDTATLSTETLNEINVSSF